MYTIHFSALETALLPYFLFIVYAAILLWVRSVREGDETAPLAEQSDVDVINYGKPEQTDFVLSTSIPEPVDSLAGEFEQELASRVMPVTRKRRSVSELIIEEFNTGN